MVLNIAFQYTKKGAEMKVNHSYGEWGKLNGKRTLPNIPKN